jgi:hypothetical protein
MNLRCCHYRASVKRLEDLLQFGAVDANPVILDADTHFRFMIDVRGPAKRANHNAPMVAAIFHGIHH